MKGRSGGIRGCSQLGLRKGKGKERKKVCGLTLLPDELVWNCLAKVSSLDLAALRMTSKAHRSLATTPYLWDLRLEMGRVEPCYYMCLHIFPEPIPRWFILHPVQRRLKPIDSHVYQSLELGSTPIYSHAYQSPESGSSFVVAAWGIFVIGGLVNGKPTSEVAFFDCFEHKWYKLPPMMIPRTSASASMIDDKIYVFGGCLGDDSNWAEVYDIDTLTWDFLCVPSRPKNIKQSVVIDKKVVYAVDEDRQSFSFSPSKLFVSCGGKTDSKPGDRDHWCLIGGFLFSTGPRGTILWCLPDDLDWKEVKGLEELQQQQQRLVEYGITKLTTNNASYIVIFWNAQPQGAASLELWSAEISLRKNGQEIRGKIEWSGCVYKLDYPLTDSNRVKVVFAEPWFQKASDSVAMALSALKRAPPRIGTPLSGEDTQSVRFEAPWR
ncbi:F-box/kelch-repeat protein At5g49000 isoform X1 [Raphanus sativus]|uniref:F-box/kelch-repeat protein At5g49000 isoform X1 n=1 Tax=Raphanus sativus TaxID=3726 RepID=A0A9W3CGX5_RAPSA|nr:F-box/kelch-repeat protein At5g49000 isoform X1 [Raphanus sativus]